MADNSQLNNELLRAIEPQLDECKPKRNSKDELIAKIIQLAEQNEITLKYSNTRLKRMNKQELNEMLAGVAEDVMRNEMAKQVGAKPGATDSVIALGALRMMHDIAARCAETGINTMAPSYGYHIVGFTECLQDPSVREATDACLVEIAQESEILQYVKSPWTRLAIAWGGALVTSVRKIPEPQRKEYYYERDPRRMERSRYREPHSGAEPSANRGSPAREVDSNSAPSVEQCKEV